MMATNYFFKNKAIYAIGIGLWMCVSCSNEELPMELSDTPVSFSVTSDWPDMQQSSRAGETEFPNGTKIGVFAFYLPGGDESVIENKAPDFMNNTTVTKQSDGNWTYSPLKYWPNNPGDEIQFYAYHPMSSITDDISISSNSQLGNPSITYTLRDGKTDLLAAAPEALGKQDIEDKVNFSFKHVLGQINVKVKAAGDFVWIDDESIEVSSVTLNSVNRKGTYILGDDTWTSTIDPQNLTISSGTAFDQSSNDGDIVYGFPRYLIPTTLSDLTLKMVTTINGTDITETIDCPLDEPIAVAPNVNYVITIILNRGMTGFTATADWVKTESHEIIYNDNEIDHHR